MDPSFFEVVQATEDDAEAIVAALTEIAEEADFVHPFLMTVEEEKQFISKMYEKKDGVILLAKLRSTGEVLSAGSCFSNGRRCGHVFTLGLTVRRQWRRRGIAAAVLAALLAHARQLGAQKVCLQVVSANAPAIALYERFGFQCEGVHTKEFKTRHGEYLDQYHMGYFYPQNKQLGD